MVKFRGTAELAYDPGWQRLSRKKKHRVGLNKRVGSHSGTNEVMRPDSDVWVHELADPWSSRASGEGCAEAVPEPHRCFSVVPRRFVIMMALR